MVKLLSTKCLSTNPVSSNAAFLSVAGHLTYAATRPSITRLPYEQLRTAKFLRILSEQLNPPCEFHQTTLTEVCGIKRL